MALAVVVIFIVGVVLVMKLKGKFLVNFTSIRANHGNKWNILITIILLMKVRLWVWIVWKSEGVKSYNMVIRSSKSPEEHGRLRLKEVGTCHTEKPAITVQYYYIEL